MFQSLLRLETADRRFKLAFGILLLLVLCYAFVIAIASENVKVIVLLLAVVVSPALIVVALRRPILFPYGLYVFMTPFDNLLLIPGAGTITKLLGAAATLFILFDVVRHKRFVRPPLALYYFLAFLTFNIVSLAWTRDMPAAMLVVQTLFSLVAMYAVISIAPIDERDLRTVCACIVLGGVATSFYGIYLLHNVSQNAGDYGRLMIEVDDRHIDTNHFANSLLAPLAFALVALSRARRPAKFIGSLCAVVVLCTGLEITLSREALIAALVMTLVLAWFSTRRVLSFAILVPALVVLPLCVPSVGQRMLDAVATGGGGRLSIWHIGWRSFTQHPLFGWGAGSAVAAYNSNFMAVYQPYSTGWDRPPHNTPLHILIDLGIIGLVLAGVAFVAALRQFSFIRRGDSLYDLRVALTAALIGLFIVSIFIDLENYKYLWLVLTTTAQLAIVAGARHGAGDVKSLAGARVPASRSHATARGLVLVGTFLAFALPCALILQWLSHRENAVQAFEPAKQPIVLPRQGFPPTTVSMQKAHALPRHSSAFIGLDDLGSTGSHFTYLGKWEHIKDMRDGRGGGTSTRSHNAGALATFLFTGGRLRIFGVTGPGGGYARLLIDDVDYGLLSFYGSHKMVDVLVFEASDLRVGAHQVSIVVAAPPHAFPKRRFVNLDGAAYAL